MDELVELLELLLVVNFLGMGRNGAQAIHDVVFNEHGGITAYGEGDGVARTRIDLMLVAIGQHDNRRVKHGRLGANDLDALELGAQGVNGIEQQVMGNRALGAAEPLPKIFKKVVDARVTTRLIYPLRDGPVAQLVRASG